MNKLGKNLIKICFCIWLVNVALPGSLAQYELLSPLFRAGQYINYIIYGLAVIALIIPMLPQKKQPMPIGEKCTLILHDLDPETANEIFGDMPNAKLFCSLRKKAACKGLYGCWFKTVGECSLRDGTHALGREIALCDEFIIVSKSLYGGFDIEVKNALDRSISFVLPFFQVRNKELHHQARYTKIGKMRVYIYNSNNISDVDKVSVSEIAKANAINMNKAEPEVYFVQNAAEIKVAAA